MRVPRLDRLVLVAGTLSALASGPALAEPAFAVRTGYTCSQCHANRTGGGMRTAFGSLYAQTILPARLLSFDEARGLLPADPDARLGYGGDARFRYAYLRPDDADDTSSIDVSQGNLYLELRLIPGRLGLYLDETVGPGGASARELFGLYGFRWANAWIKAGKLLPAYGWRLPDDDSFIRQSTGFTYSAPDNGIEFGVEPGRFSAVLSLTNGAGGGSDDDRTKKVNFRAEHRFRAFRLGVSAAHNDTAGTRTTWGGLFGGGNWGRLSLVLEGDRIETRQEESRSERWVGYVEADLLVARGLTLKYVHDWLDPDADVDTDERTRDSLGFEYVPIPFVQARLFVRSHDGPPQVQGARGERIELELHLFF
ncbi:MAG TPA: hypothetical protein VD788_05850 [Candidatus Polarisedimenticolaceae bacterium]|nr:hypothetical protein [Candidatus Polarisedimenticolaceae bacterium]